MKELIVPIGNNCCKNKGKIYNCALHILGKKGILGPGNMAHEDLGRTSYKAEVRTRHLVPGKEQNLVLTDILPKAR